MLTPLRCRRLLPAVLLAASAAALLLPPADGGAAPAKGKKYALLVGVNKYADGKLGELKYAENDVEELAKVLSGTPASFNRVIVLTATRGDDREADAPTAKNVRDSLKGILNKKNPEDTVLIALIGHGLRQAAGGKEEAYFCPADAKVGDASTLVGVAEVFKLMGESGAGTKLLLVDAARGDPKDKLTLDVEAVPAVPKGVAALFSCSPGQRSYESEKIRKGHGAFAFYVLEGLRGGAKAGEGLVTWGRLAEYVSDKVASEVPKLIGGGAAQEPYELRVGPGRSPVVIGARPGGATPVTPVVTKGKEFTNSVGMKFVPIAAGKFTMGSPAAEKDRYDDEGPPHEVEVTKPFHMAVFEVTQGQYQKVMGSNPSHFSAAGMGKDKVTGLATADFPVETVSHDDAKAFCDKLSALPEEKKAGRSYRLPTEAEWEYACRAGTATPFHYGNALGGNDANCDGTAPYGGAPAGPNLQRTTKVGSYKPNAFGLYDMHGNVCEWTSDWKGTEFYKTSPKADPTGPATGDKKTIRGGCWSYAARYCRAADRDSNVPTARNNCNGIRVVCVVAGK